MTTNAVLLDGGTTVLAKLTPTTGGATIAAEVAATTTRRGSLVVRSALHLGTARVVRGTVVSRLDIGGGVVLATPEALARGRALLPPLVEARDVEQLLLVLLALCEIDGLPANGALVTTFSRHVFNDACRDEK